MALSPKAGHFPALRAFAPGEIGFLRELSADRKAVKHADAEVETRSGKRTALVLEKNSARTRVGFEVAASDRARPSLIQGLRDALSARRRC